MGFAVQPGVGDFEGEERAAGAENSEDFGECLILRFCCFQVMQDQDGDGGGEGGACERKMCGVAPDDAWGARVVARFQFERGIVNVFE